MKATDGHGYPAAQRRAGQSATDTEVEIAIVGGGLVGASIAVGLARRGRSVAVIDEGDMAFRASRGNFALIWVQGKGVGCSRYAELTLRSAALWPGFANQLIEETGIDVQLQQDGGFQLALTPEELAFYESRMRTLAGQKDGPRYEWHAFDPSELRRYLPGIGPDVVGGIYSPLDGHCNSLKLYRALVAAMHGRGVQHLVDEKVQIIAPAAHGYLLHGRSHTIRAGKVVLAAGLDNGRLGDQVGLRMPISALKGQILVTERVGPFLNYPVMTVRQTDEGSVLLGDSFEGNELDVSSHMPTIGVVADRAQRMFPALKTANVVRTWAAARVMTQDGLPIYDESPVMPGVFGVACHSGVTLSALHCLEIADGIDAGRIPAEWTASFGTGRFDVQVC